MLDKTTHSLKLNDIVFPVYKIRKNNGIREDANITYITNLTNEELIVDNKNLKGATLGLRRLRMSDTDLYPLYRAIPNMETLIKYPRSTFIDSKGKIFTYKKGYTWGTIIYKKIVDIKRYEDEYPLVFVEGINFPFRIGNYYNIYGKYLGLINYNGGYIFYEISDEPKRNKRIRI